MADTTQAAADVATQGGGEAAESGGMPQLEFAHFPNQVFWLLIALIAIYYILTRVALPRIAMILAERKGTITNDIAAAEELKLKAQEAEKAYEKALADARAESGKIVAAAKADIQSDLDKAIEKADAEIAAKLAESEKAISQIRAGAMENIEIVAKDTAGEIVALFGTGADREAVDGAVDARMKG